MTHTENTEIKLPDDLNTCIEFHGHLCPGLVYGYLVGKEAIKLLHLKRSKDEEIVAISENDSCAVDALQVLLGTSIGKGNLILKDYGKNVYTIIHRQQKRAYRFSRNQSYDYTGESKEAFSRLDTAISDGTATEKEKWRHKYLKSADLLARPFRDLFITTEVDFAMPPYAPLARSEACANCDEMTMSTKLVDLEGGERVCIPCSKTL
jgi:formylmethanofuran dehydrogenase subunit E